MVLMVLSVGGMIRFINTVDQIRLVADQLGIDARIAVMLGIKQDCQHEPGYPIPHNQNLQAMPVFIQPGISLDR